MRRRGLLVLLTVPAFAGGFLLPKLAPQDGARLFSQVASRVASQAVDSLSQSELYEKAARGLITELDDPYADLYSPEELASFNRQTLGNDYGGVGMSIQDQQGTMRVTQIFPNSPAQHGGVQTGDWIVAVGGENVAGWRIDEVTAKLLGPPGTNVTVTFRRAGTQDPIVSEFTRARIHVPAVPYAIMLQDGIGYIPLQRFNENSGREVAEAVVKLRAEGATAFVLDIRGNPGGDLDEAVNVSNVFLPRGDKIAEVRYRNQPDELFFATFNPISTEEPMVVLVDEYAASASEIVAGALQDHDRALVVGVTSFGKGVVQNLYPLESGWALKLTTGKWYTPSGRSIQRPMTDRELELAQATGDTARPVYRSDSGRKVLGGGGVTPDVVVRQDTATTAEQALLRALAPLSQQLYVASYEMAVGLKNQVAPDFAVREEWRRELLNRIRTAGARVTDEDYAVGKDIIDRMLEQRIATVAFGDSAAFRRTVPHDRQVSRAIGFLRQGDTQMELFALAERGTQPPSDE